MSLRALLGKLLPGTPANQVGTWSAPGVLDRGPVGRPQIALDEAGNALAAWHHRGAEQEGIYICRYHADQRGWDVVPRRLDGALTQAQAPEIAMNYRSDLAVVWQEHEQAAVRVCARHMVNLEETWVPYPVVLQAAPGAVSSLHTAMDPDGNIHVVWCREEAEGHQVYSTAYHAAEAAWDVEPRRLGEPAPRPLFPQLAVNDSGKGLIVWHTEGPEGDRILACHYDPGSHAWSDRPTLVASERTTYLRMDMDPAGNALVLWVQEGSGGIQTLQASHLDGRTIEWTRSPLLSSGHRILWPQVGMDRQGRAHAAWRQEVAGVMKLFAKRFVQGRWDSSRTLLVEDVGQSQAHTLSVNVLGHALVIWLQDQGPQRVVCLRRFDGKAWSPRPTVLSASSRSGFQDPGAVLSPSGRVAVIWRQGEGEDGVILTALGQA